MKTPTQPLLACCKAEKIITDIAKHTNEMSDAQFRKHWSEFLYQALKEPCDIATPDTEEWEKRYRQLMVGYGLKLPEELHKELTDFIAQLIRTEKLNLLESLKLTIEKRYED